MNFFCLDFLIYFLFLRFTVTMFYAQDKTNHLSEEFVNPPECGKLTTWFHGIKTNIRKDGFTKDLEAIEKVGIAGVLLFFVTQ